MEVTEVISYFVYVLVPGLFAWNMRMQGQLAELKTAIAVNTSKDEEIWGHVEKMEGKLDKLIESVSQIREDIATIKRG